MGTGKSTWLTQAFPRSKVFDLLDEDTFRRLVEHPENLSKELSAEEKAQPIVIDEIQRVPELLNEVHRLIEKQKLSFVLTGSSARKLKKKGANLLAGRALRYDLFPFTAKELGEKFNLKEAIQWGTLPGVYSSSKKELFLKTYVGAYLKEEIQQEGLTRNIGAFARFLDAASYSQGQPLVVSNVAKDCHVERKVVENYFHILEDLLLAVQLPVFAKRAKRELINKRKFYFFDAGVFRTLRPVGPLDSDSEVNGLAF